MSLLHFFRPSAVLFLLLSVLLTGLAPYTAAGQTRNNTAELVQLHRQHRAFPEATFFQRPQHRVSDVTRDRIDRSLTSATVLTLDKTALKNLRQNPEKTLALALPYQDHTLQLDLVEVELFAEDFTLTTPESGPEGIPYQPGRYYRGIVRGDDQSLVAFSVFENEVRGIVSTQADGNINIVPAAETALPAADGAPVEYLIFSDRMAKNPRDFRCGAPEGAALPPSAKKPADGPDSDWTQKYVGVFFECDFDLYNHLGGINETFNYVTALFNNVAAIYYNEQINMRISGNFIWTIKDPYTKDSTEQSLDITLAQFKNTRYQNGHFSFRGNLAHLLLLRPYPSGPLWGNAYTYGVCNDWRFGFTQISNDAKEFPKYSWDVSTIAHEIGHNLGSEHTQWCGWPAKGGHPGGPIDGCADSEPVKLPGIEIGCAKGPSNSGTIMSYCSGYQLSNGFGPLPGDTIRHFVNQADCLYAISGSCLTPAILDAYSNTSCSAEIDWTPVDGAQQYNLRYRISGGQWNYKNVVTRPYTLQGLKPGVTYEVQVMNYCWEPYGAMSLYSPSYTFSTYCPKPYGLQTVLVTDHNAQLKWNADATSEPYSGSYAIRYRRAGTDKWTTQATAQKEIILQNLAPDSIYECQLNTICKCGGSEPAIVVFRTEPPCPAPTGLTVSQVTGYSAVLNWTPAPEANYYTINYRRMFSSESTTVTVAGPPVKLQNLIVGSIYEVWVSSNCTLSPNSKGSSYTSLSTMNPLCGHPSDPWVTNITTTSATINWAWMATNLSHTIRYRADGDSVVQTKLINGIQATSGVLTGLLPGTTYKYAVLKRCSNGASYSILQSFTTLPAGQAAAGRTGDTWGENPDQSLQLLLSPNPANDRCRIELPGIELPEPGLLEIRDLLGRVWLNTEWPAFTEAIDLNVGTLPAGTYMVFLSGSGLRTGRPLVVGR